ncbi:unnamed protein product [Ceratitis capitata]|uniref:(Mediterranean fruit fly) hypothetical protein n=1 Tax=Ceratitis capitata TaxID=7213 RepID=A0A811UMG5_CERCA|nr:unnamed protein product [Ceratitis capitata]
MVSAAAAAAVAATAAVVAQKCGQPRNSERSYRRLYKYIKAHNEGNFLIELLAFVLPQNKLKALKMLSDKQPHTQLARTQNSDSSVVCGLDQQPKQQKQQQQ